MHNLDKENEVIFNKWDNLYKKLKTVDEKAIKFDQEKATSGIKEAMIGYIASFGLSMIKDLYLQNTNSVGFLLSLRCIIEGIAVYSYIEKEPVTDEQEQIFKLQSFFIEKEIYENYPIFDGVMFDLKSIINNFESTRDIIKNKYNYSTKQIKEILKSKIPFLGNIKSFEKLIRENLPSEFLMFYKTLSLYAHPYDYRLNDYELFMQYSIVIFRVLEVMFKDVNPSKKGLEYEYNRVIGYNEYGKITRSLTNTQIEKLNELCKMLDEKGFNFLAFSIDISSSIMFDYFLDIAMGYTEQNTTKWKTAIENLWLLNLCIEDDIYSKKNELMYTHSRIKSQLNVGQEVSDDNFKIAYDIYKNNYPSGCEFENFKKIFISTTGYTINEKGEILSLKKAVETFIDDISPSINDGKIESVIKQTPFVGYNEGDSKEVQQIDLASFLKMKYDESQAMSHASGYLYYCLSGAWYDGTLLAVLYEEILQVLLNKLLIKLNNLYKENLLPKTMINYLRNFLKDNRTYINKKKSIYLMPKVGKNY